MLVEISAVVYEISASGGPHELGFHSSASIKNSKGRITIRCQSLPLQEMVERQPPEFTILKAQDVLKKVGFSSANWRELGRRLKENLDVDAIECQYTDPDRCMEEVLTKWEKDGASPSWEALAKVVSICNKGGRNVADKIREEVGLSMRQRDGNKGREEKGNTEGRPAICQRHEETTSDECLIEVINEKVEDYNSRVIKLKSSIFEQIKEKSTLMELKVALTSIPPRLGCQHDRFIKQCREQLVSKKESFEEIFFEVSYYSTYLNYTLVDHLINEFGNEDLKKKMKDYITDIGEFRRNTSLHLFSRSEAANARLTISHDESTNVEMLITEHNFKTSSATLEEVEIFRKEFARQYNLEDFVVMLIRVTEGSIILTWVIPKFVARIIRQTSKSVDFMSLHVERSLTCVKLQSEVLYNADDKQSEGPVPTFHAAPPKDETTHKLNIKDIPQVINRNTDDEDDVGSTCSSQVTDSGISSLSDGSHTTIRTNRERSDETTRTSYVRPEQGGVRGRGSGRGARGTEGFRGRGSGRGARGTDEKRGWRQPPDCRKFKFLGTCEGKDKGECRYSHIKQVPTYSETVYLPDKIPLGMAIGLKGENLRLLTKVAECYLTTSGKAEVKIVTSDELKLPKLVTTYKQLLSQLYPIGPGWCYLHREGVSNSVRGSLLYFREYKGRLPPRPALSKWTFYELCTDDDATADYYGPTYDELAAKNPPLRALDTKEGVHEALEKLHGAAPLDPRLRKEDSRVKVIIGHDDHMKEMLIGGLEWFCRKKEEKDGYVAKLEARFGKIIWRKLPADVVGAKIGIEEFADLFFSDVQHVRIFNTDVRAENAGQVRMTLQEHYIHTLETFDIKFTTINQHSERHKYGERVDIRIKFEDGQPKCLLAKINETKVVIFDVLCLHRSHDVRVTLNYYEVVKPEDQLYEEVRRLVDTVSLTDPVDGTISLVPKTEAWSVNFIRHKKRETYVMNNKHMVTINSIEECTLNWPNTEENKLESVTPDHYENLHTEIEYNNMSWECAFGRDAGLSPKQSLALHMEQGRVDPAVAGAIPHPWQPEHILQDFQEFLQNLDSLNETLEFEKL